MKQDYPSKAAFRAAALALGCEVATIRAFARVEAGPEGAFLDSDPARPPVILFERHQFHRLTEGRFAGAKAPGLPAKVSLLSSPRAGGYGRYTQQHAKLAAAVRLDRAAALSACSWGLFQLMGFNWQRGGFASLQDMVNAMYASADEHLRGFVNFVLSDKRLANAVRAKDWPKMAALYNGTGYRRLAKPWYDERMANAYEQEVLA